MPRKLTLKHLLTLAISVLMCALIGLIVLTVGRAGVNRVEAEIGSSLRLIADQMQDKLDRTLFERYREISTAARLFRTLAVADRPEVAKAWLEELQTTYPDYAWIGFARRNGTVARATDDLFVGADVSQRPWFKAGLLEATVGDVHTDEVLAEHVRRRADAASKFLDISAPVLGPTGETIGVLGAQLDWSWAEEVRDSLFGNTPDRRTEQVLVLTSTGVVLLGPKELTGRKLELDSVRRAMTGENRFAIETWPDGGRYVTGYARSDGYKNFAGLGWIVLVRQNADVALAPARRLQRQTLLLSLGIAGLAALAAWMLAGRISSPLLNLAQSADALREGRLVAIPEVHDYAEVESLSRSLSALVTELNRRRSALQALNESLESQVAQRTGDLAGQNVALDAARAQAEEATAAKSRFLAAASHDLRQPLHAMTLFARALSRRVSGTEALQLVAQLESSLSSLKEMFDALLNVSRLDAGLIQANILAVPVGELVGRISDGFRAEAKGRDLKFRTHVIDATVATDPALLEAMLRNLVSNALKFTSAGGVLLATRQRKGTVLIEVYDTGPGIARERQARIFEEFERSNQHATGSNDGLGLGLSIVRRYAAMLGIKIDMTSHVGHGTRFSLTIPEGRVETGFAPNHGGAGEIDNPANLRGRTVLVVDDDPQIVSGMQRELSDRGCSPLSFTSIAMAEAALSAGQAIDLAIVDFDLGNGQTGPAFLATIERARGRHLPALILTGGTDAATLSAVMATGRPWLTKPANPDAVAKALAQLLSDAGPADNATEREPA